MTTPSQRENDLLRALDEQQSDINCNLLPMIRLCLFASRAAAVLSDVRAHADISPSFQEALNEATEFPNDPMTGELHDLVAGVLHCAKNAALDMNERIDAVMRNTRTVSRASTGEQP